MHQNVEFSTLMLVIYQRLNARTIPKRCYESSYRNKLVYDASTGEIKDDRNHMSMLEDFLLPRREGGRGTEITTLPGGSNLGEIDDIVYFQRKTA